MSNLSKALRAIERERIQRALDYIKEEKAAKAAKKPRREGDPTRNIEGRIYTAFSPYVNHKDARALGITADRTTVVVKKQGNTFVYGISICSEKDQFNRKEGREKAIERLNNGFAQVDATYYPQEGETWERAVVRFANNLAESTMLDFNRFKRKICTKCKQEGTTSAGAK